MAGCLVGRLSVGQAGLLSAQALLLDTLVPVDVRYWRFKPIPDAVLPLSNDVSTLQMG